MGSESAEDAGVWFEMSRYDLDTAEAMLRAGRHLYVLFCCHQAIEKRLKGIVVERTGKLPPRTHDLVRLADLADAPRSPAQMRLLGEMNGYYTHTRYPEEGSDLIGPTCAALARRCLKDVQEYLRCLDQPRK